MGLARFSRPAAGGHPRDHPEFSHYDIHAAEVCPIGQSRSCLTTDRSKSRSFQSYPLLPADDASTNAAATTPSGVAVRAATRRAVALPRRDNLAHAGGYPSWSRRRVSEAVSAVFPASPMALSYAARDC